MKRLSPSELVANRKRKEEQDGEHILQEVLDWVDREMYNTKERVKELRRERLVAMDSDRKVNHVEFDKHISNTISSLETLAGVRKMLVWKMKEVK